MLEPTNYETDYRQTPDAFIVPMSQIIVMLLLENKTARLIPF